LSHTCEIYFINDHYIKSLINRTRYGFLKNR